ncbi:uncharacterized protein VTP21DRAFT_9787 [Calcarisporiella thermophila]|uniref:uncharacterized protein n=1 Tax=Calcarisporiella thermophila TaxID=911321 RepID=UPI00374306BD
MWAHLYAEGDRLCSLGVGRNSDGRLEVFGISNDGRVWHTWQTAPSGGWNGSWVQLHSSTDRMIQLKAASNQDGRLEVFCISSDGRVWHTWQVAPSGDWHNGWVELSTEHIRLRNLDVGLNHHGRLEVLGTSEDDRVWHIWQVAPNGGWNGHWMERYTSADRLRRLRIAVNQDGRLEVFGISPDGRIWHTWQVAPGEGWNGSWVEFYTESDRMRDLDVGSNLDGRLEVLGTSEDNRVWHTWQVAPNGGWNGSWVERYSSVDRMRQLRVATNQNGRLEVFGISEDDQVWHTWQVLPGGAWKGRWLKLYSEGDRLRQLEVGRHQDGRLEVFGTSANQQVWHTWQVAQGRWRRPDAEVGRFDLQENVLGMAGVHLAMLHTGKVLFFSYDPRKENNLNRGYWQIWDPARGPSPLQVHPRNIFCAGHCFLADGRLLVSGGQSYNYPPFLGRGADHDVHVFDPTTLTWTRHKDMKKARWYPTCVTLPTGDGLMVGGHASRFVPPNRINKDYEVFRWRTNEQSPPGPFDPGHMDDYPFLCVLPDGTSRGTLFAFCRTEARLFSLEHNTWSKSFPTASPHRRTYNTQGSFVLLPLHPDQPERVRVMVIGGGGDDHKATNTAEIFEFNAAHPSQSAWRAPAGGNMEFRRFMSDAVLLPDGTVLVVNGSGEGAADHSSQPVMSAELFDPRDESWHTMAALNRQRQYHSGALLLPDARVVVSGHTEHWNPGHEVEETSLDLYSPPYLFRGTRPAIMHAPSEMTYGARYDLRVSEDALSAVLIRASSTTHTNNMDQRYVGLAVLRDGERFAITAPADSTIAPPGFYMLFVLNQERVPSVATWVHLT